MKMFVVHRYWNIDSIYICCHAHMYICIGLYVYMHCVCVCVCGHALHSGILEQCYFICTLQRPSVHLSLEAKALCALVSFLMALQMNDRLETESEFELDSFEGFIIYV